MQVNVKGGTNAGHRVVKMQSKRDWKCPSCGTWLRYFWLSCPTDSHPRP